jgi:demethylmenaquinone methyltransferase/2-methoxy-6-polyprenyl-1,4-benzoquinol methylase
MASWRRGDSWEASFVVTTDEPPGVLQARSRASEAGFSMSSDRSVGELLAVLAAASPPGARILELGTGVGVGLAWIVHGLGARDDASVLSVDTGDALLADTRAATWPGWVEFLCADGAQVVQDHGPFELIFADAVGGKIHGLDATIASLAPRGVLVVDDMDPDLHITDGSTRLFERCAPRSPRTRNSS